MLRLFVRKGALTARWIHPSQSFVVRFALTGPHCRPITAARWLSAWSNSPIPHNSESASKFTSKKLPLLQRISVPEENSDGSQPGCEDGPYDLIGEDLAAQINRDSKVLDPAYHGGQARRKLFLALEANDSQSLLTALLSASQDPKFFQSLPPTTSAEIFRSIKLDRLIERYIGIYQHLHPLAVAVGSRQSKYSGTRQAVEVLGSFKDSLQNLLERWVEAGNNFDLLTCKTMLRIAAFTGDGDTAREISRIMKDNGIEADTEAYNYLFQARCWNKAHSLEWGKLRVTPMAKLARQSVPKESENPWVKSYKTGPGGLKQEVLEHFDEMFASGLAPDSSTFCMLITALGREGDLKAVASILKRVWDVDVEAIMNDDDGLEIFEHNILPESPIIPNEELLFVAAHIYGSNNEISTALRVVDHISRKFSLPIDVKTWSQLALWTFVLAQPTRGRFSEDKRRLLYAESKSVGKVSPDSVEQLWRVFTSDPYNIKPTIQMHNWRIKALWLQERESEMISAIDEAWKAFDSHDYTHAKSSTMTTSENPITHEQEEELRLLHELSKSRMKIRWIRLILRPRNRDRLPMLRYRRQVLPRLLSRSIEYWNQNHTNPISYTIWTGRVQFHKKTADQSEDRPSKVLVTHKPDLGLYVVHFAHRCLEPSYQGQSGSIREARKRANAVQAGIKRPVRFDLAWHEMPEIKDWVWINEELGYALGNGMFRNGRLELPEPGQP